MHLRLLTLSTLPGKSRLLLSALPIGCAFYVHLDGSDFVDRTGDKQDFVVPAGERSPISISSLWYALWLIAAVTPALQRMKRVEVDGPLDYR
jgi:hypothetical protein